jgi:hypothetical protein
MNEAVQNQTEQNSNPEVVAIDRVIQESRVAIEGETQAPVKKRGGRRPGAGRKKPSAGADTPPPNFETVEMNQTQAIQDLTPILGPVIGMPFDAVALRTGFDGFKLAEDEKKALAPQLQQVLNVYMPQLSNSPHAALMMFAGSIGMLALTKYMAFMSWQRTEIEKSKSAPKTESKPETTYPGGSMFPTIQAN